MKFYFVELTHKVNKKVIHKFGITNSKDVLDRFADRYPERDGYKNFDIKVLYSTYTTDDEAKRLESDFLGLFPRIGSINEVIGDGYDYNYKNTGGITEWRLLTSDEKNAILRKLYN